LGFLIGEAKRLRAISNMAMREGDRFVDFRAFKTAMQDWGLNGHTKFNILYQKSDSSHNIVACARAGCPFRVYAVLCI